jgi:hypothetical protein
MLRPSQNRLTLVSEHNTTCVALLNTKEGTKVTSRWERDSNDSAETEIAFDCFEGTPRWASWKDSLSSRSNGLILRQTHTESPPRRPLLTLLRRQLHRRAAYQPLLQNRCCLIKMLLRDPDSTPARKKLGRFLPHQNCSLTFTFLSA